MNGGGGVPSLSVLSIHGGCCTLTSQDERCSHGNDGALWGSQGRQFVEVVHSILEEERNLNVQQLIQYLKL